MKMVNWQDVGRWQTVTDCHSTGRPVF